MESSYCYFAPKTIMSEEINMTVSSSNVTYECDKDTSTDNDSKKSSVSSSASELTQQDDDDVENTQMFEQGVEKVKKNLINEEEFRFINHSEPIHIFLKVKPLTIQEIAKQKGQKVFVFHDETGVSVNPPKSSCYAQNKQTLQTLSQTIFQFSYVFQQSITQNNFFRGTIYPCFEKFFQGDNLLIFSYGVTNSGKTYTMQGTNSDPGLIPRTLDYLFDTLKASQHIDGQNGIYNYKPDKFNEITLLTPAELNQEMAHKEKLMRLSGVKEMERFESFESLNDLNSKCEANQNLLDSKKFGSLDSLSTFLSSGADSGGLNSLNKIVLPSNKRYAIWISFYEIYNDSVYDLLTIKSNKTVRNTGNLNNFDSRPSLKIREDSNKIPYVEGLTHVPVVSTKEAIKILKFGEKNLQKSSNTINANSSRSHAVFCLKIVSIENDSINKSHAIASINQLSFCDLAGLERSSKTQTAGKTLKEASNINQSLLALNRCICTMIGNQKSTGNKEQIPYRINKLTRLFQAYFEGRGMVKMVVNFNPSLDCFDESVGVLKFSAIANQIKISQQENKNVQYKIDTNQSDPKNRLTVGWDSDAEPMDEDGDENEEEDEDDDDDEEDEDDEDDDEDNSEEGSEASSQEVEGDEDEEDEIDETTGEEVTASEEDSHDDDEDEEEDSDSEEDDDDDDSEEDDDEEEDEDDDSDEEEDEEGDETIGENNKSTKSIKSAKKKVQIATPSDQSILNPNKSAVKHIYKKTPCINKTNSLTKSNMSTLSNNSQFCANESLANRRKSILENELTKEQLVEKVKTLQEEIQKHKKEHTKFEAALRSELVGKWSKRVEETEEYFQEELVKQRKQIEEFYVKRLDMLEKLLKGKHEKILDELRLEKENELEKQRELLINLNLELRTSNDETERLRVEILQLNEKLKQQQIENAAALESYQTFNKFNSTELVGETQFVFAAPTLAVNKEIKSELMSQSNFDCELKLDNEGESDEEDSNESAGSVEGASQLIETTAQSAEATHFDEEMDTCEETELEEETGIEDEEEEEEESDEEEEESTELEEEEDELETEDQSTQTTEVETRSVEVEVNLTDAELKTMSEKLQLKEHETELFKEKLVAKINLIESLNVQLSQLETENKANTAELETRLSRLAVELETSQEQVKSAKKTANEWKEMLRMQNDKYEKLEFEFKNAHLELEQANDSCEKLKNQLIDYDKMIKQMRDQADEVECELKAAIAKKADEIALLETDLKEMSVCFEKKSNDFENIQNDIQFYLNQIEKLEFKLETLDGEKTALSVKYDSELKRFNEEKSQFLKELDGRNQTIKQMNEAVVERDAHKHVVETDDIQMMDDSKEDTQMAVKPQQKSSLKSETSKSSLKKSTRSSSMLNSSKLNAIHENKPESKLKSIIKPDKKSISKSSKSKSEEIHSDDNNSVAVENEKIKKKLSVSKKVSSKKDSVNPDAILDDIISLGHEATTSKPAKSTLVKKKSTLNRLTEMISKSPILEPLRNRPTRGKKPTIDLADSSVMSNISLNTKEPIEKTSTLTKKTTKKVSKVNLLEDLQRAKNEENENKDPIEIDDPKQRKTRKKKA